MSGRRVTSDEDLRTLLAAVRVVAVIGLSPRPARPSHQVAAYLKEVGYRIVPVHPAGGKILGEPVYPHVSAAASAVGPIDLVDVFRRPEALADLVPQVAAVAPRALWLQLGVVHAGAEAEALAAGLDLVSDRCILVEHRRLLGA